MTTTLDHSDEADALLDEYANRKPEGPGVFQIDGTLFRVQKTRDGSGRMYAKKLVGEAFEYDRGAIHGLREADRITYDQAVAYGLRTGVCLMCSLALIDPVSVEGGIGPVCEQRWFPGERKARQARMKAAGKATTSKARSFVKGGICAVLLASSLTLQACSGGGGALAIPAAQTVAAQPVAIGTAAPAAVLVAVGDSISSGYGSVPMQPGDYVTDLSHSFPQVAATALGVALNDLAVPGNRCEGANSFGPGVMAQIASLTAHNAQYATIDCGAGEQFEAETTTGTEGRMADFDDALAALRAAEPQAKIAVIVSSGNTTNWQAHEQQVAQSAGAFVIQESALASSDLAGQHPSLAGTVTIGNLVASALRP